MKDLLSRLGQKIERGAYHTTRRALKARRRWWRLQRKTWRSPQESPRAGHLFGYKSVCLKEQQLPQGETVREHFRINTSNLWKQL